MQKINLFFLWIIIYLWNDIIFLIQHAEAKLMKIDDILYTNEKRIAHLYYNTYSDDSVNRFHKNLFNTNRLYLFDRTEYSKPTSLAIKNYREMLKEKKSPKTLNSVEKKWYEAAKGNNIFISDRNFVMYVPAVLIFILGGYIDFDGSLKMYLTFTIILIEISRIFFNKKMFYIFSNIFVSILVFASSKYVSIYFIDNIKNAV